MRYLILILSLLVAVAFIGSALASPPGKTVEYTGGEAGKVIFNGSTHGTAQGMKCPDCHPKLFQMKKGTYKMTKEDHGKEIGCGACHNGTKAFSQSDEKECGKCHLKAEEKKEEIKEEIKEEKKEEMKEEMEEMKEKMEEMKEEYKK